MITRRTQQCMISTAVDSTCLVLHSVRTLLIWAKLKLCPLNWSPLMTT